MFVLDTNVVSELRKARAGKANRGVTDWASGIASSQMFLSSITLFELELGVLRAERADPPRGAVLRRWLDESVAEVFSGRVLPVDGNVARRAARLHVPDPVPFRDALIGAAALEGGMAVVTRDVRHFARFADLQVVNPWR
ncbi:MAG: type II toxin-antitoxin system VapC family toxin [Actinomycetota bacterium]|nr:type II toxin-antitoxin system VapC family toxin [Actinomycetota bacterium]